MEIASDKAKLDTGLNAAKAQITEFAGKANSLLGALGIGLGAAGVVKLLGDIAEKGSNLGETMSKVKEVFGSSTGAIVGMAQDLADKFGAVKQESLDAAANFGLVTQAAKMTAGQSAELSVRLTRLAIDAASFYNTPIGVALEKIRSGLVGEAEPLRAFGVLLSEDAVKSRALADGAKMVSGELSEQEKVAARAKLIIEGLSKAQGDAARTADSYANQVKRLRGELENWKADVGGPIAANLAGALQATRDKGIMAGVGAMLNFDWQKAADAAAGVQHGFTPPAAAQEAPIFDQVRKALASRQPKMGEIYNAPGMAGMNFMSALRGGGLGQFLNQIAMRDDLNGQIAQQKRSMNAWGGGHVMDTESFMRQQQEQLLKPKDETAEKQLAELIKAREALDKLVGKQEGKQAVKGVILKGRES